MGGRPPPRPPLDPPLSSHSPVEKEPLAVQAYMCWLSIFLLDVLSVSVGYAEVVRPELVAVSPLLNSHGKIELFLTH